MNSVLLSLPETGLASSGHDRNQPEADDPQAGQRSYRQVTPFIADQPVSQL
jgi:hypothetical protein